MGRELQKKKNKSGLHRVRQKPKSKKKVIGNALIAANWFILSESHLSLTTDMYRDQKQTLAQNYRRLGLTTRLNKQTGGVEKGRGQVESDSLRVRNTTDLQRVEAATTEVRIERDDSGAARLFDDAAPAEPQDTSAHTAAEMRFAPLLVDEDELDMGQHAPHGHIPAAALAALHDGERNPVVAQLAAQASLQAQGPAKKRKQSEREEEWVAKLVARHGEDLDKMVRDHELNVMQQSKGDIRRRVSKWRESRGLSVVA